MQFLKHFCFGHIPIDLPYIFLALVKSLQRMQKSAQNFHNLEKVNFLCGTILRALQQMDSALDRSAAIYSSKTAQLYQIYIYRLQNRFYSAGGISFIAAQQTSLTLSMFLKDYYKKIRLSHAQQFKGFFTNSSLYILLLYPSTTSSIQLEFPCSFSKFRQASQSFFAFSFGICLRPNLKICLALQYYLSFISNFPNSRKYVSLIAQTPSQVIVRSNIFLAASFSLFLNQNLATLMKLSRLGNASKYLQSIAFAFSCSPILSQYLMKAIQAFSPGHHSIHLQNRSLAFLYQPMSYSIYEYLNQN